MLPPDPPAPATRDDGFDFAPVSRCDPLAIEQFAATVWPAAADRTDVLAKWWMTTGADAATAAIDRSTGAIAGLCVGVPSDWLIGGRLVAAASICNWFVSPAYMGRGLGKALVRSFGDRAPFLNAFSVSPAAIDNFRKLGWIGPFRSQLLLFPLPALRGWRRPRPTAIKLHAYRAERNIVPTGLAEALDRIDREKPPGVVRRRRAADDLRRHLSYLPSRAFDIHVVSIDDAPIGYFALRPADHHAGRRYRQARLHYVSDLVLNRADHQTVRQVLGAIAAAPSVRRAGAILLCTTDQAIVAAAASSGWLTARSPLIGPALGRKAPLYMKGDGFKQGDPDGLDLQLTFFDSDVDLNI